MDKIAEATQTVKFDAAWISAVTRASALAQAKLPEALHGRIQRATALVLNGKLWLEEDGYTAQAQGSTPDVWYRVDAACECVDYTTAPHGHCKHRLARALYLRAGELLREPMTLDLDPEVSQAPAGIRREWITTIRGKQFVQFQGLLALAHERGLVSLTVHFTLTTETLAVAEAEAVFADGRRFSESADATPTNVNKGVAAHFMRCALTRAKARALRDALNIGMCAVEELED